MPGMSSWMGRQHDRLATLRIPTEIWNLTPGLPQLSPSQPTSPQSSALAHPRADKNYLKFQPPSWALHCNALSSIQTSSLSSCYMQHKVTGTKVGSQVNWMFPLSPSPAEDKRHLGGKYGNYRGEGSTSRRSQGGPERGKQLPLKLSLGK